MEINLCNGGTCQKAALFYVSPSQINFLIPFGYSGLWSGGSGNSVTVNVSINGLVISDPVTISPSEPRPFLAGYDCWFDSNASDPSPCTLTWKPISFNEPLRALVTDQKGNLIDSRNPAR
ncbi:MAG: hypothetical protein ACRD4P_07580, partial [Bryobacteraceae bacterium]